jgi:hypothetical protein
LIQLEASNEELYEALNVSLIVGGSITIPHIRRAFETIDACREMQKTDPELNALLYFFSSIAVRARVDSLL